MITVRFRSELLQIETFVFAVELEENLERVGVLCARTECSTETVLPVTQYQLEVLRERRPPPNASIIDNPVNPDFGLRTHGSGR